MVKNYVKKRLVLLLAFILFLMVPLNELFPIPREIEYALKLNRINHYDEALNIIYKALEEDKIKPDITSAYTIGRILYRKAYLYREMADVCIKTNLGYYLQLQKREKIDIIKLFLGISHFYNGQYIEAAGILNQVIRNKKLDRDQLELAYVYLGASYYRNGEKSKAQDLWKRSVVESLLAKSTLGYIYAYLMVNPSIGEAMAKEAMNLAKTKMVSKYDIFRINHAYTLLALGNFSDAYEEIKGVDLNIPIFVYKPSPKKEIKFYDISIIDSYSKIIFGESIKNLEPIVTASSGELASFAAYYVAQMYVYLGDLNNGMKYVQKAQRLAVTGSLTMMRSVALESSIFLLQGKIRKGVKSLKRKIQLIYGKPSFLLEMMKVVIQSGVPYNTIKDVVITVENYIYNSNWSRNRRETALMGDLSLYSGRFVKAIYFYERARDKGNKNKIETNDPDFMINLAYVYYAKEYYPESLEILFSLDKYFKGIRPIQNAVQSVYSFRQKGTGEALMD